ncbi:hypothetical protein F5Y09DRAFT_322019 [Xylaria sp. FL1042]|nr:hypothetical protein F5Y09DRAFT_322019 [Xylaria sp. FL1042]
MERITSDFQLRYGRQHMYPLATLVPRSNKYLPLRMSEEAAGVILCCMPATAALFKAVQFPMVSWLPFSKGKRTPRLRSNLEPRETVNSRDSIYCHPGINRHIVQVDSEVENYPLQHLDFSNKYCKEN